MERLKRLLQEKKIEISLTDSAKDLLAKQGFDPAYGARPLKRLMQQKIQDELATRILDNEIKADDKIIVDAKNEELVFDKG